jgi:D-3-phosphoglycerate dehydrogenase
VRVLCDPSVPLAGVREVLEPAGVAVERARSLPAAGDDVVGLVWFGRVSADDLERLPGLRVVATPSIGVDHLDVGAASARGVWVCHVPDYCVEEVADHALALLLALVRGVVELDRSVRAGEWRYDAAGPLGRVSDLVLGVVGLGRIGRALVARARALGMEVKAHDPLLADEEIAAFGAAPVPLDDLLRGCNALSVHVPLDAGTRGLLGRRELALLPRGAYVVNVSRAGVVDAGALLEALAAGRLAGAALDVLDVEPPTAEAPAPLAPGLVVTPHAAWYSEAAEAEAARRAAESVLDALERRRPRGAVNEVAAAESGGAR